MSRIHEIRTNFWGKAIRLPNCCLSELSYNIKPIFPRDPSDFSAAKWTFITFRLAIAKRATWAADESHYCEASITTSLGLFPTWLRLESTALFLVYKLSRGAEAPQKIVSIILQHINNPFLRWATTWWRNCAARNLGVKFSMLQRLDPKFSGKNRPRPAFRGISLWSDQTLDEQIRKIIAVVIFLKRGNTCFF